MSETEKILLQLTARALFHAPAVSDAVASDDVDFDAATFDAAAIDWPSLYREASSQALTLLIWDALSDEERSFIPESVSIRWEQASIRQIIRNEQLLYEQSQVLQILDAANIPCAILKGSSSAACYPNPSLRIMGDIDLLVDPAQQTEAVEILLAHGYKNADVEPHYCEMAVIKDGVTVEVHNEPNGLDMNEDPVIKLKLDEFFSSALKERQIADGSPSPLPFLSPEERRMAGGSPSLSPEERQMVDGLPFLSDEHQALVLLIHKLKHFLHNELGLRQLCDWAVFVDQRLDDELWRELRPKLEEFGLLTFTGIVTRVCVEYLGLPEEKAPWAKEFDKELAADVLNQILECGNFGNKAGTYGISYFTDVNASGRISSLFKNIFGRCKYHWPVCAKYPVLLPVAPFVAYGKYLKFRKEGKRDAIRPVNLYKKAEAKRKLYKELKPFSTE